MMDETGRRELRSAVAPFETPNLALGLYQIISAIALYVVLQAVMYWSLGISYALTLALAVPASVLVVRIFIIQHDCGHGSFFASRRSNDVLGAICGVLTLAPYASWRRQHAGHHANWNNLDRRESGTDIYSTCLTVEEYRARSPWQRFLYRLPRHPLVANILLPPVVFLFLYRTSFDTPKAWTRERRSVWSTNIAIAACAAALGMILGFGSVLMVQLPIIVLATIVGVWLFSVQHRFETAQWLRQPQWDFADAALKGSSHLDLPRALHWVTGNIGFHHIHHLSPRVPNYRLAACHRSNVVLRPENPLSLGKALSAGNLALWDENQAKLVRFRDAFV
jgi:omega-6 fatty acid desaturase (delta-12 desaturase)